MADENTPTETPAAGDQPAAQVPGVQMRLLGQYLKDLSFEAPNAPEVLTKLRDKPEIKIDMNTRNRKVEQGFEVELTMKASCSYGGTQGFVVETTYAAVVAMSDEATDQVKAVLLNVEVPQLLFPYIRALMSDDGTGFLPSPCYAAHRFPPGIRKADSRGSRQSTEAITSVLIKADL